MGDRHDQDSGNPKELLPHGIQVGQKVKLQFFCAGTLANGCLIAGEHICALPPAVSGPLRETARQHFGLQAAEAHAQQSGQPGAAQANQADVHEEVGEDVEGEYNAEETPRAAADDSFVADFMSRARLSPGAGRPDGRWNACI